MEEMPLSVCVCTVCVLQGRGGVKCREVSDGGGAEEVSDKEVSVMERGASHGADLQEK